MRRKRLNRPEESLQRQFVAYLRAHLPAPWIVFHVPNGGGRSAAEAGILRAMGVLAGVPDLFVIGPAFIAAIELKAPPKRLLDGGLSRAKPRLNRAQRALQADLGACGVPVLVVDDLANGLEALRGLGAPLRGRQP